MTSWRKVTAGAILLLASIGAACADVERGSVTNLPIPRYVSLKAPEANVRRGPSLSHRIDWVFQRRAMPLKITDEYGHWRRVQDIDGAGGWMHYSLLSGARTVIVREETSELRLWTLGNMELVAPALEIPAASRILVDSPN